MCHQCRRNDKGRVISCTRCRSKRFCIPCFSKCKFVEVLNQLAPPLIVQGVVDDLLKVAEGDADLYSACVIKIKKDQGFRTYYISLAALVHKTFGTYEQHVALFASINSGKAFIVGATASQSKWDEDGVKLRSAAISLAV